ncbi:hypothetical protein [Legionella drozanskii]|uniref:Uncharacterized protein n=1 Tax=Legionella drozanskii LLAP-1 TaxID=1212489 RepID=A0A0W0SWG1_9GAMM|nr:hypothetical protein [Legionella drozanskii]KTC87690.1 hypothetical protein Ldro_1309 [Legionella drozanskii LLAP-1]
MLNIFIICSDPTVDNRQNTEVWRNNLHVLDVNLININRKKQQIPSIPFNDNNDNSSESVLLITGEHGDIGSEIYNEVFLSTWVDWVEKQNGSQFDLIIVDLCDSSYLISAANFKKLVKPEGVIISCVSTCHGMRDSLLQVNFSSIPSMLNALKENIENTTGILGGSNISLTKKKNVSFPYGFFYSESTRLICDAKIPNSLGRDNETVRRKVVLDNLGDVEVKQQIDLPSYFNSEEINSVLKQDKINWLKVGLFATTASLGLGLGCAILYSNSNGNSILK